ASNGRAAETEQESTMTNYETPMSRMSFGLAAIALSAVTFGLPVILPPTLYSEHDRAALAAKRAAPIEVSITPARITVTGECEKSMAYEPAPQSVPVVDRSR